MIIIIGLANRSRSGDGGNNNSNDNNEIEEDTVVAVCWSCYKWYVVGVSLN